MKRNFKLIYAAFAAFAVVLSCTKVENSGNEPQDMTGLEGEVTISATLSDVMTKVAFTPAIGTDGKPESLALTWAEGDKLRIYNSADKTQYADFELAASSVGQKTGAFTGNSFAAASYDVEVFNGELEYATQTQPSDGATTSLKYLASAAGVTDLKSIVFTEFSSVLAITAKMPEGVAANVSSVVLTASEAIFNAGNTLTVNLTQKGDAGNDGLLNIYATLPMGSQQIAEGTTLLVSFNAPETDHTVYTRYIELAAANFAAGKLNTINIDATESATHAGLVSCDGTTSEKAYLIADKYQMQAMAGLLVADATTYFKMVADVDLTGVAWTSVSGNVAFDGSNHKITNYTAASGLFGTFTGNIQNLTVDGATVTAASDNTGVLVNYATDITATNVKVSNADLTNSKAGTGVLIGKMEKGTLKGCETSGSLTTDYYYSGGLVGYATTAAVENCSADVDIINNRTNYSRTGGLIGEIHGGNVTKSSAAGDTELKGAYGGAFIGVIDGKVSVNKCYATGNVAQKNEKNYNGGLIGWVTSASTATVSDCYSAGTISGKNYCGGFVGYIEGVTTITNSFTKATIDAAKWSGCVFAGNVSVPGNLTLSGFIGWNISNRVAFWYNQSTALDGNYMGTEGTISAKAKEFEWDETIWDLSGDEPKLK